jgi:hypothetical protein
MSKFEKSQRVNVPGGDGTQGVIIDIVESVPGFPVYALRWLTPQGEPQTGSCGEGDLAAANPPTLLGKIDQRIVQLQSIQDHKPASIARKFSKRKR